MFIRYMEILEKVKNIIKKQQKKVYIVKNI